MTHKWFILFLILNIHVKALDTITVSQGTIKVGGLKHKSLYFGMAAGDKLVFTFEPLNDKSLMNIEIIEQPGTIRYSHYKAKGEHQTCLYVSQKGVYEFQFKNSALFGRHYKYKIQRIPALSQTVNFNTKVYTKIISDTIYFDKSGSLKLVNDTTISEIVHQVSKVHSTLNPNGNDNCINFAIPKNTVAWSYYIGVNQQGQEAFENATFELAKTGSKLFTKIPNFGPLAALALYSTSYFARLQSGEDIDFEIRLINIRDNQQNDVANKFIKKGKVINDFAQLTHPLENTYELCLHNDNAITGVTVLVKIVAICVTKKPIKTPSTKIKLKRKELMYLKD